MAATSHLIAPPLANGVCTVYDPLGSMLPSVVTMPAATPQMSHCPEPACARVEAFLICWWCCSCAASAVHCNFGRTVTHGTVSG